MHNISKLRNQPKEKRVVDRYRRIYNSVFDDYLLKSQYTNASKLIVECTNTLLNHKHNTDAREFFSSNMNRLWSISQREDVDTRLEENTMLNIFGSKTNLSARGYFSIGNSEYAEKEYERALRKHIIAMFLDVFEPQKKCDNNHYENLRNLIRNHSEINYEQLIYIVNKVEIWMNAAIKPNEIYKLKQSIFSALLSMEEEDFSEENFTQSFSIELIREANYRIERGETEVFAILKIICGDINMRFSPNAAKKAYESARDVLFEKYVLRDSEEFEGNIEKFMEYCEYQMDNMPVRDKAYKQV